MTKQKVLLYLSQHVADLILHIWFQKISTKIRTKMKRQKDR